MSSSLSQGCSRARFLGARPPLQRVMKGRSVSLEQPEDAMRNRAWYCLSAGFLLRWRHDIRVRNLNWHSQIP